MATAFTMTGASALLGDYYSRGGFNRRENALSLQGFFCAVGGAVFISIAEFVSSYSWRYPFFGIWTWNFNYLNGYHLSF